MESADEISPHHNNRGSTFISGRRAFVLRTARSASPFGGDASRLRPLLVVEDHHNLGILHAQII